MRRQILLILALIIGINGYSQISFETGYYIDNNNQKINCLIKNLDWRNNPTEFQYKLSENNTPKKKTIKSVKEFGIDNISKYVRSKVKIDNSDNEIDNLSNDRNPVFQEEELFLKVLVDGKAILYEYIKGNARKYFYKKENTNIEQLVFKKYLNSNDEIAKNSRFRQQLWTDLKCPDSKIRAIENLEYKKNDLVRWFTEYSACNDNEIVDFGTKEKRDLLNITIRPRINNSSLALQNGVRSSSNTDFGSKIGFGLGIEAEFILPFNKNKWAITIEPTYQSFKSETPTFVPSNPPREFIANVEYSSIELPISLRHYLFLNKNSKIFINASYIFDLSLKSSILEIVREDGFISSQSSEIDTLGNLGLGIGYKQNDRYSVEVRYQTSREILAQSPFWRSEYNTFSIIFGYSLF